MPDNTNADGRQSSAPNNILSQSLLRRVDDSGVARYPVTAEETATQFGVNAIAQSAGSCAIGAYSLAADINSIALGLYSRSNRQNAISIGSQSEASGLASVVIGTRSIVTVPYSVAIGHNIIVDSGIGGAIALGYQSKVTGDLGIAIGASAEAFTHGVAIGYLAATFNHDSAIAIGQGAMASGLYGICIGAFSQAGFADSIALGRNSGSTVANQCVIGDSTVPLKVLIFDRLQFYGTSASFPALKRSGVNLQVRLANDSAASDLEVLDEAYGPTWDGSVEVPTKNAVYDKIQTVVGNATPLFDHYADVGNNTGTGETDLYSDILAAGQFASNGDKIISEYGGTLVLSATATRRIRCYFGGTVIFDSGALSITGANASWDIFALLVRESSTVVRCVVTMNTSSAALTTYTQYTKVTGLTLSNTQILKITGEAAGVGAANSDIVAALGYVQYNKAA